MGSLPTSTSFASLCSLPAPLCPRPRLLVGGRALARVHPLFPRCSGRCWGYDSAPAALGRHPQRFPTRAERQYDAPGIVNISLSLPLLTVKAIKALNLPLNSLRRARPPMLACY